MHANEEQMITLKNDLIVTTLEDEGLIVDLETRRSFWLNDSACYLLRLFKGNSKGFPLSSVNSLLSAKYSNIEAEHVSEDVDRFINDLKHHNLLSTRLQQHRNSIEIEDCSNKKVFIKPIMEEEFCYFPITRAAVKGRVSPAVRQAQRKGQRAF